MTFNLGLSQTGAGGGIEFGSQNFYCFLWDNSDLREWRDTLETWKCTKEVPITAILKIIHHFSVNSTCYKAFIQSKPQHCAMWGYCNRDVVVLRSDT